jgi:uncharacterized protein (TIGR03000 family)
MIRQRIAVVPSFTVALLLASAPPSWAGFLGFGSGIGPAMFYGPYTGGHRYSYNVAYSYGFAFNAADTWRSDPLAYPAGVDPYRYWRRGRAPAYAPPVDGPLVEMPGEPVALQPVPRPGGDAPAMVLVEVPAGAQVFFDGDPTRQTGSQRTFETPPLSAGKGYTYMVRARWKDGEGEREQVQAVPVRAGQAARVRFPTAP